MVEKIGSKGRPMNNCYHKNPGKGAPETQVEGERLREYASYWQLGGSSAGGVSCQWEREKVR